MREIWGENEVEKSRGARSLKFVHVSSRDQNIYVSPEIPDSIPGSTIVSIDVSREMKLTVVAAILAKIGQSIFRGDIEFFRVSTI